jgi:hypothetical protein
MDIEMLPLTASQLEAAQNGELLKELIKESSPLSPALLDGTVPSGTYRGDQKVVGQHIVASITIDDAAHADILLDISGNLVPHIKINCTEESFSLDSSTGVVTLPGLGTQGDCAHDNLNKWHVKIKSIDYDDTEDKITIVAHAILFNVKILLTKGSMDIEMLPLTASQLEAAQNGELLKELIKEEVIRSEYARSVAKKGDPDCLDHGWGAMCVKVAQWVEKKGSQECNPSVICSSFAGMELKACQIVVSHACPYIVRKIESRWSPKQICRSLPSAGCPDKKKKMIRGFQ